MASRSQSDAALLLNIKAAAEEATSAIGSVVGSRCGKSRGSRSHRRSTASTASRLLTAGSHLSRASTRLSTCSSGPLALTLEENQQRVQDEAMDRYMQSIEKDARDVVKDN